MLKKNLDNFNYEEFNSFLQASFNGTVKEKKQDEIWIKNKIIVFFNYKTKKTGDKVTIMTNLNYSCYLSLYTEVTPIEIHSSKFVPLDLENQYTLLKKKDWKEYLTSRDNINCTNIMANIKEKKINVDLNQIEQNVYFQSEFKQIIFDLSTFCNETDVFLDIKTIDLIQIDINEPNKFIIWNEIVLLGDQINYFGKDDDFKQLTIKLPKLTVNIYPFTEIIPISYEEICEYLKLDQKNNYKTEKVNKQVLEDNNLTGELAKHIHIYIQNYIFWKYYLSINFTVDEYAAITLIKNDTHAYWNQIKQIDITQLSSVTQLGKLIFDYYNIKHINDIDSIILGKATLISGITDIEYTNQEFLLPIVTSLNNKEVSNWEQLSNLCKSLKMEYVYEYDIKSSHMYGATSDLIIGRGVKKQKVDLDKDIGIALASIDLQNKNIYFTFKPMFSKKNYITTTNAYGWFFIAELNQLKKLGCTVTIHEGYLYDKADVSLKKPIELIDDIKLLTKDQILDIQLKKAANNFFGSFAHKRNMTTVIYKDNYKTSFKHKKVKHIVYKTVGCYLRDGHSTYPITVLTEDLITYKNSIITYSNITANSRINFREKILAIKQANPDIKVYIIKTDAIFCNKELALPDVRIGELRLKKAGFYIFFSSEIYLNITEGYLLTGNKKVIDFNEIYNELLKLIERGNPSYKIFNQKDYKFEYPNTDYINKFNEDLFKIATIKKKKEFTTDEILSTVYPETRDFIITVVNILTEDNAKPQLGKLNYAIEFETGDNGDVFNIDSVEVPKDILTNSFLRRGFTLKINEILQKKEEKYSDERYGIIVYLCTYCQDKEINKVILFSTN